MNVGGYIYRIAEEKKLSVDDIVADLEVLSTELGVENFSVKKNEFKELFLKNEAYSNERLKSLYQKVLPYYIGGEIAWDLRPVFKTDSTEILTTLPVAIWRLRVGNYMEDAKTYSFQILEKDIKALIDELEHSMKELKSIKDKMKID